MSLSDNWISCRAGTRSHATLPLFLETPPRAVAHLQQQQALDSRPALLPGRPSLLCVLGVSVVSCLSLVGLVATTYAAAGPVADNGRYIAQGMRSALTDAIRSANEEAEREARRQLEANRRYVAEKDLARVQSQPGERARSTLPRKHAASSSLLLRIMSLRKVSTTTDDIDMRAVDELFPAWVARYDEENRNKLNSDAVIKDIVLAVAQLAETSATDIVSV